MLHLLLPLAGYGENLTDSNLFETGPSFTIEPDDLMYDKDGVYDYAMMECRADGNPEPTYTWYLVERSNSQKVSHRHTVIGVNHPAIVWEIPHFGLFPAFLQERPACL